MTLNFKSLKKLMNYSAFLFPPATLPDSYFSKEKTVKKKVKRAVVKAERKNYKSRRVAGTR